jgi:hypothetical protein
MMRAAEVMTGRPAWRWIACTAVALVARGVLAQTEEQPRDSGAIDRAIAERLLPEVTTRLKSELPATVAWGGWLAQRYGLKEAGPDLLAAWQRIRDWSARDALRARIAVLDACVQLEIVVPPGELPIRMDGLRVPTTILLARAGKAGGPQLLEQFRQFDQHESKLWLATGDLLASLNEPGFLAEVAPRHRMLLSVTVRSPTQEFSVGAAVGGFGLPTAQPKAPPSFPPMPVYSLVNEPVVGDRLLARGASAVYWRRREDLHDQSFEELGRLSDAAGARWWWLRAPVQAWDFDPNAAIEVTYRDGADYLREVQARGDAQITAFRTLLGRLQQAGRLTADEVAAVRPNLELRITDLRGEGAPPLPAAPFPLAR